MEGLSVFILLILLFTSLSNIWETGLLPCHQTNTEGPPAVYPKGISSNIRHQIQRHADCSHPFFALDCLQKIKESEMLVRR
jgi:hypothetical protein